MVRIPCMHIGAYHDADQLIASALGVAQALQPWAVPYSDGFKLAAHGSDDSEGHGVPDNLVPHIYGSHCVLHAAKSLGKLAAVYEERDHLPDDADPDAPRAPDVEARRAAIRAAAADLITAAIRFANLEGFHIGEALIDRVREKNGRAFTPPAAQPEDEARQANDRGSNCEEPFSAFGSTDPANAGGESPNPVCSTLGAAGEDR